MPNSTSIRSAYAFFQGQRPQAGGAAPQPAAVSTPGLPSFLQPADGAARPAAPQPPAPPQPALGRDTYNGRDTLSDFTRALEQLEAAVRGAVQPAPQPQPWVGSPPFVPTQPGSTAQQQINQGGNQVTNEINRVARDINHYTQQINQTAAQLNQQIPQIAQSVDGVVNSVASIIDSFKGIFK